MIEKSKPNGAVQTAINSYQHFRRKMRDAALGWRKLQPGRWKRSSTLIKRRNAAIANAVFWRDAAAELHLNWIAPFTR